MFLAIAFGIFMGILVLLSMTTIANFIGSILLKLMPGTAPAIRKSVGWSEIKRPSLAKTEGITVIRDPTLAGRRYEPSQEMKRRAAQLDLACTASTNALLDSEVDQMGETFFVGAVQQSLRRDERKDSGYRILPAEATCWVCQKKRKIYHSSGICGRCFSTVHDLKHQPRLQ